MSNFKPSKYQKDIYNWINTGSGNCIIQAVAGSGKTTTIIEATKLIPQDKESVFLAFNKSIANELKERLPENIRSCTLHSLGLSMFYNNTNSRPQIKYDKLQKLIEQSLVENNINNAGEYSARYGFLKKIIPLIKATLIDYTKYEELEDLKIQYSIDGELDDKNISLIKEVLNKCKQVVEYIDFDDMIWIPIVNEFSSKTYDWVFVDETQDLNKSQLELVKKICNGHTRIVAVGDRKQSIYAFRGANIQSMDDFKEHFNADELPLSISYRCPKKVVELAKSIVDEIETFDDAKEGVVESISFEKTIQKAKDGDLVLCRTNAPLVPIAFALIRNDKKAIIRGRDIGKNLIKLIDRYTVVNLNDLVAKILNYRDLQEEKLFLIEEGKHPKKYKNKLLTELDACDTILEISNNSNTIDELKNKIETIFSDEKEGIICSSVHKAKGLEADTVFIENYDMMPHPMAKTKEEIEQEWNIKYVAITRAKNELYIIGAALDKDADICPKCKKVRCECEA